MTDKQGTLIVIPETGELEERREGLLETVETLSIETAMDYVSAGYLFKNLKALEEAIHAKTDEPVSLAHKTHKAIKSLQNDLLKPVEDARKLVKRKMGDWDLLQERKRREEQERIEAENRRVAEEQRLAAAEEAEKAGDGRAAEAILEAPIVAPPTVLPKTTPKVEGVSFRTNYEVEVIDEAIVPVEYKKTDLGLVKAKVKQMDGNISIPGIKITAGRV